MRHRGDVPARSASVTVSSKHERAPVLDGVAAKDYLDIRDAIFELASVFAGSTVKGLVSLPSAAIGTHLTPTPVRVS